MGGDPHGPVVMGTIKRLLHASVSVPASDFFPV